MIVSLILVVVLTVGVSMFCSLAEATLLSLSSMRLESMRREKRPFADFWLRLKENIDRPISAILILNTVANTGGATVAGTLFTLTFGPEFLWAFLIFMTVTILYLSEIAPKTIGAIYCEQLMAILAPPLRILVVLISPLIKITEALVARLKVKGPQNALTTVDLEVLAQLARSRNLIAVEQERIIINAAKLRMIKVSEVMIPREWILFLRLNRPVHENLRLARHALHTRYPVSYSDSPDEIMGYINFKDLTGFQDEENDLNLEAFIRPILSLDPDMDLSRVLRTLSAKRYHIALVRDDQDHVLGMITLEDVIEELVGEIEDEFDQTSGIMVQVSRNLWRVGASLTMGRLGEILDFEIPEGSEHMTVGAWLERMLGGSKYPGANCRLDRVTFTVQQARRGRVFQVVVEIDSTEPVVTGWDSP